MDTLTLFIMSLLAPFVRPIIDAISKQVKSGSSGIVDASGRHQYEPWTDPLCTDPTHSLLSKDHFGNMLNSPAGELASAILKYVAPRVLYAWEHPDIPVEQVLNDVCRVFHHPALRDSRCEIHNTMYSTVERWARSTQFNLNDRLSAESVRNGKNLLDVKYTGQAFLGGELPTTDHVSNTFSSALGSQFGNILKPLGKVGKMTGLTRDGGDLEAEIGTEYPGLRTEHDAQPSSTQGAHLQPPGGDYASSGYAEQLYARRPLSPQPQFGYSYGSQPGPGPQQGYGEYAGKPPPPGAFDYYPPQPPQGGASGYGGPPQGGEASGYYSGY